MDRSFILLPQDLVHVEVGQGDEKGRVIVLNSEKTDGIGMAPLVALRCARKMIAAAGEIEGEGFAAKNPDVPAMLDRVTVTLETLREGLFRVALMEDIEAGSRETYRAIVADLDTLISDSRAALEREGWSKRVP